MRVNHRTLARLFLLLALACAVAAPGAAEQGLPTHNHIAELVVGATRLDWLPAGDSEHLVLTVAGPAGLWVRKDFAAGQTVSLSLSDPEWERLPDGTYTWELRVISLSGKLPQRPLVESGHFFVKDGSFVPARKKASATPQRPPRLITAESHINDDLSVTGNVCIGTSCTSADPDPNLPSLILKSPQPHIRFDDQFVEGGSTPHDWAVFINPSSAAEFSIVDVENVLIPFTIAGGAPNSSVYVASNGNVGLGTTTPSTPFHLQNRSGNTNTNVAVVTSSDSQTLVRVFETTSTGGVFAVFDSGGNEDIRLSATGTSWLASDGDVGIGTTSPSTQLHVRDTGSRGKILAENASGTAASREMLEIRNNGGAALILKDTGVTERWSFNTFGSSVLLNNQANAGIEYTFSPTGNLTIAGTLTQGSDRDTKRDIAPVQPEEILAKVASLPITTWNRKTDPPSVRHLGPMAQDFAATFNLGDDDRHIAVLDIAGVSLASIQALHRMITEKEAEITQL
ncbi:MAG TPA: tail fiber domain-containing protein, partial [Thermoanaerobaculia bacterium]|nr:tail fiber domain-containing protein [Thermoanaerobaculia bacterium]